MVVRKTLPRENLRRSARETKPLQAVEITRKNFLRSLRPLHYVSAVFALWPFERPQGENVQWPRRRRFCTTLYTLLVMVAYTAFHLYTNYTDEYDATTGDVERDGTGNVEGNFVSIVIDIYNRYSGLILFWLLHLMAFATQNTLTGILAGVMLIDEHIAHRLSVMPDHSRWCRFICLHVAFIFLAIGFSEWYNCLMYMSDFIPASEYCIFQCYITMLTSSTVEIQYMALVAAIHSRLRLINELLGQLNAYGTDQEQARYDQYRPGAPPATVAREQFRGQQPSRPPATAEFLLVEIAPAISKPAPAGTGGHANAPTLSVPRGDARWQRVRQLQHKIITVNQAPPPPAAEPRPSPPPDAAQFPLLVASLLNSQSRPSTEHIGMKIINDIKNLYTHLHLLSLNINKAFGAQLIFILLTLFVTLTTLLYYCTMKLFRLLWLGQRAPAGVLRATFWEVGSTVSWAFLTIFRMQRICNVCNSAKNEAQKIGSLIHGLGWKTHNRATKAMIRILSLQLQQQRIEFTAGGLFAIDHGLMFNIVGSLVTYLLILIQFDIAQNGAKWKADPPAVPSTAATAPAPAQIGPV